MAMTWRLLAIGAAIGAAIGFFTSCGASDDKDDGNASTGGGLSFTADINPIIVTSCGGSDCHTSGSGYTTYVGSETNLKARATDVKSRLALGADSPLFMPKTPDINGKARTISADDTAKIIKFLDQ